MWQLGDTPHGGPVAPRAPADAGLFHNAAAVPPGGGFPGALTLIYAIVCGIWATILTGDTFRWPKRF